jgi:hypothetical protein
MRAKMLGIGYLVLALQPIMELRTLLPLSVCLFGGPATSFFDAVRDRITEQAPPARRPSAGALPGR